MNTPTPNKLWGSFELPPGTHATWRLGPLAMWVERGEHEWSVATKIVGDPLDDTASFTKHEAPPEDIPEDATRSRCAAQTGHHTLHLAPALADRPVVVRAEQPFTLPPADETCFFVSSPVWLRLSVGEPPRVWADFASLRPSDTWFGPSTREGELCYASKTRARMSLAGEPIRPARALTMIRLSNEDSDSLVFERLKIPVAYLGLFAASDGRLWTQSLEVVRTREGADVQVSAQLPPEAGATEALDAPRESGPNLLKRAIHALFG